MKFGAIIALLVLGVSSTMASPSAPTSFPSPTPGPTHSSTNSDAPSPTPPMTPKHSNKLSAEDAQSFEELARDRGFPSTSTSSPPAAQPRAVSPRTPSAAPPSRPTRRRARDSNPTPASDVTPTKKTKHVNKFISFAMPPHTKGVVNGNENELNLRSEWNDFKKKSGLNLFVNGWFNFVLLRGMVVSRSGFLRLAKDDMVDEFIRERSDQGETFKERWVEAEEAKHNKHLMDRGMNIPKNVVDEAWDFMKDSVWLQGDCLLAEQLKALRKKVREWLDGYFSWDHQDHGRFKDDDDEGDSDSSGDGFLGQPDLIGAIAGVGSSMSF